MRAVRAAGAARGLAGAALDFRWVLAGVLGGWSGWLVLPPLVVLVWTSLTEVKGVASSQLSLQNYARLSSQLRGLQVLANTGVFALGSALLATALGTTLAWLVERTNAPFRYLAYVAAFLSLSIPLIVKVLGFVLLLGPEAGVLNVWATRLFGARAAGHLHAGGHGPRRGAGRRAAELPARHAPATRDRPGPRGVGQHLRRQPLQIIRRVTLPLAAPAIAAVFLLNFITTLQNFDVRGDDRHPGARVRPHLADLPGAEDRARSRLRRRQRPGRRPDGARVLAFYPYYRLLRQASRYATITGKGFRQGTLDLGGWRPFAGLAILAAAIAGAAAAPADRLGVVRPVLRGAVAGGAAHGQPGQLPGGAEQPDNPALGPELGSRQHGSASAAMLITAAAGLARGAGKLGIATRLDQLAMLPLVIPGDRPIAGAAADLSASCPCRSTARSGS